ncbi:MAG: phytanoyl-CoA dioxygenase family protein [Chloroflexota bacterium]
MQPFYVSNDIQHDPVALRHVAELDGYIFLQDVLNKDLVLETRRDIVEILQEVGWIDAGTDAFEAISSHPAIVSGMKEFGSVYDLVLKLESFNTLAFDPAIMNVMTALLGEDVLLQPSNIARFIFPSAEEHTTPPHQDYVHIQGTPDVWTTWLPLGDCPHTLGGLSVLSGSHKGGILPVSRSMGAGGLRTHLENVGGEWVSSPFNLGDVLFFHSHTVHQGMPNKSGDRLRLSVDYRYQRASDPVMELVLTPHQNRLSWEEVYQGWKSDQYQYHWQKYTLTPVPKEKWVIEEDQEGSTK